METINVKSLPVKKNDWLLDLGCGEGRHCIASQFYFPEAKTIGLDISHRSLLKAQQKQRDFSNRNPSSYVNSSGFSLPFRANSMDHVICSEVLEHIHEYSIFLEEINRVLKPGGYLYLSVPRAWPEKICWLLSKAYYQVEGGHVRIFNTKQLKKEIKLQRFTLLRSHWAHALHSPYWWLKCLWWNNGKDNPIASIYHKLLVWDLLKRPPATRILDRILNPVMGKSAVFYFQKQYTD